VQTIACDLSTPRKAVVLVEAELRLPAEGLDILVLDAGIFRDGTLADIDLDDYYENMEVNLNSSVVLTQLLLPHLRRGVNARIVIVGSTAAYEAYPLVPTYGIAKWGLRSFALNLRHELMPEDIGVTFISPGGTLTDMWAGEDLPPRRLLEPRDIGVLVRACLNLSSQAVVEELIVRPMLGDIHE
jgi:NAD(P)-dependent dehydrogenase (short-subunit alcohol dehydrogenase family)